MGDAGPGLADTADRGVVEVNAVGQPDVRAGPAVPVQVLGGRAAEPLPTVRVLFDGLRAVRVHPDATPPGQVSPAAEQFGRDRERRAGRHRHPDHRVRCRVVVGVDGPLGLGQRGLGVLDRGVGGQAALRAAQVHRAPGRLEADAQLAGGPDLRTDQVAGPAGEHVVVVGGGAAPAGQQGGDRGPRGGAGGRLIDPAPDRVQGLQPLEQVRLLRHPPGQPLVEVVVGVDQARGKQVTGPIHPLGRHAVAVPGRGPGPGRGDPLVLHHHVPGELGARGVHGGDVGALDDDPAVRHAADVRGPRRIASTRALTWTSALTGLRGPG